MIVGYKYFFLSSLQRLRTLLELPVFIVFSFSLNIRLHKLQTALVSRTLQAIGAQEMKNNGQE